MLTGLTLPSREWWEPPPPSRWFDGGAKKSPAVDTVAVDAVPTLELQEEKQSIKTINSGKGWLVLALFNMCPMSFMPWICACVDFVSGLILQGSGGANRFKDHNSPPMVAHE